MDKKQKYFFKKCVSLTDLAIDTATAEGGAKTSTVQILRTGSWDHPVYGQFAVSVLDLEQFVQNFKNNVRGVKLAVDVNHHPEHRAVGWFTDVYREGDALFAVIEWTGEGEYLITSKQYRYFSPELFFSYRDEETKETIPNVLVGGGITNRPFFKGMQALQMSEPSDTIVGETRKTFYFFNTDSMKKPFSTLVAEFADLEKVNAAQLDAARLAFSELSTEDQEKYLASMSSIESKFSEDEAPADDVPPAPAGDDAPPADPATPPADPIQASEAEKAIAAKLFNETGMTLDEIKSMQKTFSDMQAKQYKADLEKQVNAFTFSESNKAGNLLPKARASVVEFAAKIPQNLVAEFFEILKGKNFVGKSVEFGEKGTNEAPATFSVPAETPAGVDRESFVLATIAKQFSETRKVDLATATLEAHKYIRENSVK